MPSNINHKAVGELLISNGFYQIIKHVTAGWFHKCGAIVYYSRLQGGVGYIIRYKLEYFEARNEAELTKIIKHFHKLKLI